LKIREKNNYNHNIIIGPNKGNNFINTSPNNKFHQKNNVFEKEENKNYCSINNNTNFTKKKHLDISYRCNNNRKKEDNCVKKEKIMINLILVNIIIFVNLVNNNNIYFCSISKKIQK